MPFGRDVQSQDATVEQDEQGEQTWVAAVLVARLLAGDGFFGPEQGAKVVAECVTGRFYGNADVDRIDERNQATTVDGRSAWLIEAHLTFSLPNIETTGKTMIMVVVETVTGEAGLFYASIPDTSPQFMAAAQAAGPPWRSTVRARSLGRGPGVIAETPESTTRVSPPASVSRLRRPDPVANPGVRRRAPW